MLIKTAQQMLERTHEEAAKMFAASLARRRRKRIDSKAPLPAFVDQDRWIAICTCGAGVACDPAWPAAYCYDCGTAWPITWPDEKVKGDIEAALELRPAVATKSWCVDQAVATLAAENVKLGLVEAPVEKRPIEEPTTPGDGTTLDVTTVELGALGGPVEG